MAGVRQQRAKQSRRAISRTNPFPLPDMGWTINNVVNDGVEILVQTAGLDLQYNALPPFALDTLGPAVAIDSQGTDRFTVRWPANVAPPCNLTLGAASNAIRNSQGGRLAPGTFPISMLPWPPQLIPTRSWSINDITAGVLTLLIDTGGHDMGIATVRFFLHPNFSENATGYIWAPPLLTLNFANPFSSGDSIYYPQYNGAIGFEDGTLLAGQSLVAP